MVVHPSYHQFALHDPTCDESSNFAVATPAASRDVTGFAPNAVAVRVVADLVRIRVRIELLDGPATADADRGGEEADLDRGGMLELPGGRLCAPESTEERWMVGV